MQLRQLGFVFLDRRLDRLAVVLVALLLRPEIVEHHHILDNVARVQHDISRYFDQREANDDGEDELVISGIDVPQFAVAPERGSYTSFGINDNRALASVVHELWHSVFGPSDHYGKEADGSSKSYLNIWCVMDTSGDFRNADDFYGPQNMPGYTNLESNIVRALEIKETRALAIDSAARRVMSLLCYA